MIPVRHRRLLLVALPLAALLAACASTPPDATVQVFTPPTPVAAGTTYRLERLPLQASQPGQPALEAAADAVLARAGLRRDDAAPRLSVQVSSAQAVVDGYGWGSPAAVGIGIGSGGGGSSVGVGLGIPIGGGYGGYGGRASQRVDVVMRDLAPGQVVFQSLATGSSGASAVSLLQAALSDFPNAPAGVRRVPLGTRYVVR